MSGALSNEVAELQRQLDEALATIEAIRSGAVDGLVNASGVVLHGVDSSKPYVAFFDAMNEGGVTLDAEFNILHCNPCFSGMVDLHLDSLRGKNFKTLIGESDRLKIESLVASDKPFACEAQLHVASHSRPVRLSFTPIDAEKNGFRCLVVTDLSDRVRAETELRIAAIAFESRDAAIITDASGRIIRVNRAFTELTGFQSAELVGQTPRVLKSSRHDEFFYRTMWESLRKEHFWQGAVWNTHRNGRVYAHLLSISAVLSTKGAITNFVGTYSDITTNKEAEAEIHRLAYYDALTGLPNRRMLMERLKQAMAGGARSEQLGAVIFLDLDNFKTLNDTRGHDAGDAFLKEVAARLCAIVRESDTVSRIGGDEFVIVLEDLGKDPSEAALQAHTVGEKIRESFCDPYVIGQWRFLVSASLGVAMFSDHQISVENLLKHADLALYKAKDSGRNTLRFYDPVMQASLDHRVAMEADLRQAVEGKQLVLFYQPQLDINKCIIGAEVLLRWMHPSLGMVSPLDFIPLAESTGLILPIGKWVLESAAAQLVAWSKNPVTSKLRLSANVSLQQFKQPNFVSELNQVLTNSGANPNLFKVEFTESLMVTDTAETIEKMNAICMSGITFSIDDFGTGFSSLSYLTQLPIDQLKIDKSFVANLPHNSRDSAVAQTIINMARSLAMQVIAEGVETQAQFECLVEQGCDEFQGYLFAAPLPLEQFEDLVLSQETIGKMTQELL